LLNVYLDLSGCLFDGNGDPPIVDMGAYEFQPAACPADLDGSGDVGFDDLLILLAAWGPGDLGTSAR
jgi:hypothetical protein